MIKRNSTMIPMKRALSTGCKEILELPLPAGSTPPPLGFLEVYILRAEGFHFSFLLSASLTGVKLMGTFH